MTDEEFAVSAIAPLVSLAAAVPQQRENSFGEARTLFDFYYERPGPQGFLVRVPPQDVVRTHFHDIDQFQIFFGAVGSKYQSADLGPGEVLVHYVDRYRSYGPITAGEDPFDFFTLRPSSGDFIRYLPEAREEHTSLVRPHRQRHLREIVPVSDTGEASEVEEVELFPPAADGLRCTEWRIPANEHFRGPDTGGSAGQYYCIVNGTALAGTTEFGAKSLGWVGPEHGPLELVAGEHGVHLLMVQFPMPG
jgi:hypothetical protein